MAEGGYGDPENPFADPSVTDMTSGASRGLGDFNPFAEQDTSSGLTTKPSPTTTAAPPPQLPPQPQAKTQPSQPAVLQTHQDPPPYVIENEQENLRKRQEDLERKAAELQRKEQELQRMQYSGYRENNFPPLPKWFKCKPCFYHDIQVDIPIEYQKLCRFLFIRWQAYSFVMFYNFIVALALLSTSATGDHNEGKTFGLSILYLVWNVPASFLCWYRPAYKALKNDSSFSYIIFFLIFFLHISINIYYTLGMPGGGSWYVQMSLHVIWLQYINFKAQPSQKDFQEQVIVSFEVVWLMKTNKTKITYLSSGWRRSNIQRRWPVLRRLSSTPLV